MSIELVRQALEDTLLEVDGIRSASGWPTDQVGAIPFVYVGFDEEEIIQAPREITIYHLDISVVVHRKGANLVNETKGAESFIEPIKAKLRSRMNLGIPTLVDRVQYTRVRGGIFQFAGTDYAGFVMSVDVKTHKNVSFG